MNYIQLNPQSVVVSVTESSQPIEAENVIETPVPRYDWLGYTYDRDTDTATPPVEPEPAPPKRYLTKRAFWNRFPDSKEAVMRAIRIMPPAGTVMLAGVLDRLNSRVDSSPYVNLDDAQTVGGIDWLASNLCPATVTLDGVSYDMRLTAQERDAVLLAPIQEHETYP